MSARRELLSRKGADRPCRRRPPGQLLHHFVVLSEAAADVARSECDLTKRTTDLDRLAAAAAERVSRFSLSTAFRNDDAKLGRSVGRSVGLLMKSCAGRERDWLAPRVPASGREGDGRCHFDFPYRARRRRAGALAGCGAVLVIPCVIVGRGREGSRGRRQR